jgi:hypothetical protein
MNRNIILIAAFLLAFAAWLGGVWLRDLRREAMQPREALGGAETCLNCHGDMAGFSPFHDPKIIGCASCHLGNPRAVEEKKAHKGMVLIPGNLSNVYQTCGTANCHHDLAQRVEHSLMTTMAGVVSADRFVFGEIEDFPAHAHIAELGFSPADQHLRHLCASCHLGNEKTEFGPISERSRGGGCLACHLNPSLDAEAEKPHVSLTVQVSDDHCFGCHSRSGRISLGYQGWHETLLGKDDPRPPGKYRVLQDGRVVQYIQPDVHHASGMACIDCHSARETMGDGHAYLQQHDAVKVRCADCHFSGEPGTVDWSGLDEEDRKIMAIRGLQHAGHRFVVGEESGLPIWNLWVDDRKQPFLVGKNTGEKHPLKAPAPDCTKPGHAALDCAACHSAWAPQCIACHTAFNPEATAFDLLDKKRTQGKWEEYIGGFFADPPVLGVVQAMEIDAERVRKIKTFIPGMIMTIDTAFHRLYAPVAPHTTVAQGRACESCHLDPLAMGYGRGKLVYEKEGKKGKWRFYPEYAASEDGLPQDAWIPFLEKPAHRASIRDNARPFTVAEQHRILAAGACLTCHKGDSRVMQDALMDFAETKRRASKKCLMP